MRFTIARKIGTGFGLFIVVVAVLFILTNSTLNDGREGNRRVQEVYAPSLASLEELNQNITRSIALMRVWAHNQTRNDQREKLELVRIMEQSLPKIISKVDSLSEYWSEEDKKIMVEISEDADMLTQVFLELKTILPDHESYKDLMRRMQAEFRFEQGEIVDQLTARFNTNLTVLTDKQETNLNSESQDMIASFDKLNIYLSYISIAVIIIGVLIAFLTSRSIVTPVNRLKNALFYLGRGIYPKEPMPIGGDEIGDMAIALNRLVDGLGRTREFATEVGQGNFDVPYEPLSKEDELGHTLLKMRDGLAINERELEKKVEERTEEVTLKNTELEMQKNRVTELYKDLKDSINYAKRLQNSILPAKSQIKAMFPESFVFYRPKDIVSGDFYWFKVAGNKKLFAAVDCTGHGVPGAFMSLVGHNVLNQVTKVFTKPSSILNNLNRLATEALQFTSEEHHDIRDGMDLALCTIDSDTLMLEYSGAYNPVYVVREKELITLEGNKYSIGSFDYGEKEYNNSEFQLEEGDAVFVFTDGYADQFGGPRGKKFMKKQFRQLLCEIADYPMSEQKARLDSTLRNWKGELDQVDDILVIGIRV